MEIATPTTIASRQPMVNKTKIMTTIIAFDLLTANLVERVGWRNKNLDPTTIVQMVQ